MVWLMSQVSPGDMADNYWGFTLMLYGGPPTTHTQAVGIAGQGQRINLVLLVCNMYAIYVRLLQNRNITLTNDYLVVVVIIFALYLRSRKSSDFPRLFGIISYKVVRLLQFSDLY